ncbi:hypothetical protein PDN49_31635 [Bacillus cereus]|nr:MULTISPECIES: hypothetical protein [Bacillus cereus group]MDA2331548.1 hypothetical protein [Bacillus cereus]MDA2337395.1 hypothetical protein [Bacillus cereus]MDA2359174.1 hypothetical protein [Bacillus cereus]HDR4686688.1 hypothetical protein [Bacillus cereus]
MIEMAIKIVGLISGVLIVINTSLDIHTKATKKLQDKKKRSRNKRKRK